MAGKVTDFDALTSPADADVMYIVQTSDNTDKKITVANMKAGFGSAQYTVETATDNKSITSTAVNYMLVFTRQATAKTITLPDAGTTGRTIKIVITGTSVGNVTLANGDSATVGGFAVGDWEWDGTGGVTLIDDGTNWQVGESGIWDSYSVTYDSDTFPADKMTNGRVIKRGRFRDTATVTQAEVFSALDSVIPNNEECIFGFGSDGASYIPTVEIRRKTSTTMQLVRGSAVANATITDGSASVITNAGMTFGWETKNTVWTS